MDIIIPFKGRLLVFCPEGFDLYISCKWMFHGPDARYLRRSVYKNGKTRSTEIFHRVLMGPVSKGKVWDHINGNTSDNRKTNLREATFSQNNQNRKPNGASNYVGVCYHKNRNAKKKWYASIHTKGKKIVRYASTEIEAARIRDDLTREHFKEFGRLNFP